MAITHVQSGKNGTSGAAVSIAATVAAIGNGNAVAGFVTWATATTTDLTSVTDDKSNIYTIVDRGVATGHSICIASFYLQNITNAPTVITANFGSSISRIGIFLDEYSGVATVSPLDGHNLSSATGIGQTADAVTSGTFTTTGNGDLIYGAAIDITGLNTLNAGTGFTVRINNDSTTGAFISTEDKIQTSAGTIAATFTMLGTNNDDEGCIGLALSATAAAPPTLSSGWMMPFPYNERGGVDVVNY